MGADISRLPSNTENPLVNDYWFSLWWKMGHGCREFISAGGNDSPTSKRQSLNLPLFLRRLLRVLRNFLRRGQCHSSSRGVTFGAVPVCHY